VHRSRRLGRLLALGLLAGVTAASPARAAEPGLVTGFNDSRSFSTAAERPGTLQHVVQLRGKLVRHFFEWRTINPTPPPDAATAADPAWPGYRWGGVDDFVRDARAAGLTPVVGFLRAPDWAEGPGRPPVSDAAPVGSWRPDAGAYGRFATAAVRRYAGQIRHWQPWNEPNLAYFLAPQWKARGGGVTPASPGVYKGLLNTFYASAKAVDPKIVIVSAGTAPFGDPKPGGLRMPAAYFNRTLLCVRGRVKPKAIRGASCRRDPARFDVLAHHPYPIGPPGRRALNPDDVVIPDFAKLTRPLAAAIKARHVRPAKPKPVWATEISWDSNPPDPGGLPLAKHARWTAGALYVLWRQGVDAVTWWNVRDEAKGRGYEFSLQSGMFLRGATPEQDVAKPAAQVFRFPFTAYQGKGVARLWGKAPAPGVVTIQRGSGDAWKTVERVRAGRNRIFTGRLRVGSARQLRAVQNGEASVPWATGSAP
jgi:hypothetical protein